MPGNHDAYVPGAFDKVCRSWGAWMTRRRIRAGRPPRLSLSPGRGQGGADRRIQRARHRALHGQRLLPRGPVAPARRLLDDAAQAGPVPRRHDPSSAGAQRGGAAQAAVRHRQFPEDGDRATAPSSSCTAIRTIPSLYWIDGKGKDRCRWSASRPAARRSAARIRRRSGTCSRFPASRRVGAQADTPRPHRADHPGCRISRTDLIGEPERSPRLPAGRASSLATSGATQAGRPSSRQPIPEEPRPRRAGRTARRPDQPETRPEGRPPRLPSTVGRIASIRAA